MENPSGKPYGQLPPPPPEPDWLDMGERKEPRNRDHPIWGTIMVIVICVTGLLMVQMITDYHW